LLWRDVSQFGWKRLFLRPGLLSEGRSARSLSKARSAAERPRSHAQTIEPLRRLASMARSSLLTGEHAKACLSNKAGRATEAAMRADSPGKTR
jgi:hypothetical protein